jgi:hypothetical protein
MILVAKGKNFVLINTCNYKPSSCLKIQTSGENQSIAKSSAWHVGSH